MTHTTVLVGTTKGAFLLSGTPEGDGWSVAGPFCDGWPINHMGGDPQTGRIWAVGGNDWFGAGVWRSGDGSDWTLAKLADGQMDDWVRNDPDTAKLLGVTAQPPAPFTGRLDALWSVRHTPQALYAGSKPARLFRSTDGGETWAEMTGLTDHPSSDSWQPGAVGLTLHSIVTVPDAPEKIWVAISAAPTPPRRRRATRRPGTASRPAIACTTSSTRRATATCSTSRTTMASSARAMAGGAGTRSPTGCPRPSAFPSGCTRATPGRSGRCR